MRLFDLRHGLELGELQEHEAMSLDRIISRTSEQAGLHADARESTPTVSPLVCFVSSCGEASFVGLLLLQKTPKLQTRSTSPTTTVISERAILVERVQWFR